MWRVGLTGSIPAELGNLSNLEELRLDQNDLTGSIPTGLGSLSNLRYLSFSINDLSGGIPSDFGSLSSLEYLSLDRNHLGLQTHPTDGDPPPTAVTNPIPASLGNLSSLQGLGLDDNSFSGSIPSALGNLGALTALSLSGNNFDGNIPTSLGNLTKLELLNAWGNNLSGSIPSQLGNLTALEYLDLAHNSLENSIPSQLGRLSSLKELYLSSNRLRGSIPSQLGDLTNLEKLVLDTNQLNGSIPSDLGDLAALIDLELARNELSGAIPSELGDLFNLESLNLNDNALSGNIPAELGNLSTSTDDDNKALDYISLSCNLLTGNAPSELGDLLSLSILLLDNNKLNTEAADRPASFSNIGYVRWTSGTPCPRGQPDAEPPSSDDVPPTYEEAELSRDGLTIVLTYNESLDSSNLPAATDFTVKVDGTTVTVSTVAVRIREVRLGLGGAVTEHQGVTVAYDDPTTGDDENAIQDRAGNDAADLAETTVTNESTVDDEVAPTFDSSALSTDGTTITLTYNEILDSQAGPGTTNFAVEVEGESRDISSVSVRDKDVNVRLGNSVTIGQSVSISYYDPTSGDDVNAIQDRAGNDVTDLIDHIVTNVSTAQDNRAPMFSRAAMSSDGSSITLVYDEVLDGDAGPAASNFSVEVDGDSAEPSQVALSGRTVVLTLATAVRTLQDVTVSYTDPTSGDDANAIQDAAGNDAAHLVDQVVTNSSTILDQVPPVFQSVAMSTDGTTITLTYDEILDSANGPATANFQVMVHGERRGVSDATVADETVVLELSSAITTGLTVTLTYSDPTVGIDDLKAIQDRSGNDADSLIDEPIANTSTVTDSTAPKFVRAVMSSTGQSITLTYDEVLDDANGPATSDFSVTVDEEAAAPSSVTISGRTVVLELGTGVLALQDVSVSYTDPGIAADGNDTNAIQDVAGNDAASLVNQTVANASTVLDVLPPVFESAATSSDGAKIILTYDEILDSTNKPATADFTITVESEAREASTVTVVGKTVELGLGTAVTSVQTVTVAYTDPSADVDDTNAIQDRAGNDAASFTATEVTNDSAIVDATAPAFVRAVLASDGWTITLTYDEVLDDTNEPATTDFAVTVDGDSREISSTVVRGRDVVLFISGLISSLKEVKASYTDPSPNNDVSAIQDPAGNDAASLVDQTVTNASTVVDNDAPVFQSATTSTDGTKIILTYNEVLNSVNGPAPGNFTVKVQDEPTDVSAVSVSGKTVVLELGSTVTTGETVTVEYTDPTPSVDDTNAIQDRVGNDADNLYERIITNASTVADTTAPRFVRAAMSSDGVTLTMTYDEVLDETNQPATSNFAVSVAGQSVDVTAVDVDGRDVPLTLDSTVTAGQDVKVTYTDPTTGDDANAIQDPAGNDAATLTNRSVTNSSTVPDVTPPEFVRAEISSDGLTLTLTYNENLDGSNGPVPTDFVVSAEGERRQVSTVTVNGTDVQLRLAEVITSVLVVAVTYTDPTAGVDDSKAIQDTAGNDAASLSYSGIVGSTVLDSSPPGFVQAVMSSDGGTITLTFDEVLDADRGPLNGDFTVKVDGESVTLSTSSAPTVRGRTVVVGLDSAVTAGQDVTVTYTDPSASNDNYAIQDPAGNDAATLTDQMVTNASTVTDDRAPEFVSATTASDGLSIVLTYDEDLDSQNKPRTANFWITVQGERRDVSTVDVSGRTVTLGLGAAITTGQLVAITYTDPTAAVDDRNAIQDEAGNDAASLSETVTNASSVADTTAPSFVRAVLSSDGGTIVLTYDEVLDATNIPGSGDFTVTVDGQSADLASGLPVSVRGRTVRVGLDAAVTANQDVRVTYTDPTDAVDDANAIQDPAGNDAASLTDQAVTNASAVSDERAPEFRSATTTSDGLKIILTFYEDLDTRNGPRTSDFGVTVQGERQAVSKVTVSGKTVTLELRDAITSGQTVAVTYTDPTAGVDDRNAIQDTVGNDAASLAEPVTNNSGVADTQAPSLDRAETTTDGGRIVLTYDEVLDDEAGPAVSDFSVEVDGEAAEPSDVEISGRNVVLTLASTVRELQVVTVSYTDPDIASDGNDTNAIQDPAGNDAASLVKRGVTNTSTVLDQVPPVFQSVEMSTDGATITLTYDEVLDGANGPSTANFQVTVQGERRGVSDLTVSGRTVELDLASAITAGLTVTVTYNDPTNGIDDLNAIQDRSGNDAGSLIDEPVTNVSTATDSTAPKFLRAVMSSNGQSITLTYDEALDDANGPATTNFTVTVDQVGAEPSQVTLSGRTVVLELSTGVLQLQDVTVSYTDPGIAADGNDTNAIQDVAGNDAASLVNQMVANASTVLDVLPPVFQSAATSSDGAKIILTYDEILDRVLKPATADFSITVETEERGASTVTVTARTVELGLSTAVKTGQAVTVAYTDPTADVDDTNAIQDRAGNDAASLPQTDVTNDSTEADSTAPTFVRAELASNGVTLTLTYDEVLDSDNPPRSTDFSVTVDGDSSVITISNVIGRDVLLYMRNQIPSLKDVRVSYTDPSANDDDNAIQDRTGNDAASLPNQTVTNASTVVDQQAPLFQSATTSSDGETIILTYDETLDSVFKPSAGNFVVEVHEEPRDISSVNVSGKTVELELSRVINTDQPVTVAYTDPTQNVDDTLAIQDLAGNDAASLIERDVTNVSTVADTRPPGFVRAAMSSDGVTLTMTYDEVLDSTNQPSTTDFAVAVAGSSETVSTVNVSGRDVELQLGSAVTAGQDVKVTYTDPTTGDDANAIQDPAGNDAATLTNQSVTNTSAVPDVTPPVFVSAAMSSDGLTLTLTYNENLDSGNGPATADFVVSAEGERRQISTVTVSGTDVELRMASAITAALVVAVTYTDPTAGVNDTKAIQDVAGNDAANLSRSSVIGSTVLDTTPPGFVRAVVSSDGGTITLTYDEVLDADHGPVNSNFTVKVDGEAVTLSTVSAPTMRGRTVVVGLDTAVTAGQDVTVTYTDPSASDDGLAIQDPAGNDAATLTDRVVTNASTVPDERAPVFVSATTSSDGRSIVLTLDEDLDSQNKPRTANFWITVQGERQDVSTVDVSAKTVTLGLGAAITVEQSVTVTYTDPTAGVDDRNAIQDEAGNDAASLSETVTNASTVEDTTAPTFVRAVLSSDGGTIVLTYDEVLDATNIPASDTFAVTVDGQAAALASGSPISVRGRTVSVGLDAAVTADQDVEVTYTDPTTGDDTNAIQDTAGNDAASLPDQDVTNASAVPDERAPEFLSAVTTSDGLMIVLTFVEDLNSRNGPRTGDFGVTVQGERQSVSKVTVTGKTVTLDLSDAITNLEIVAVIYTDPTAGVDDRNAIQDSVGNDAASLTESVTNNSGVADTQAPSLDRAETTTDGGRIVLIYDEVLDDGNVPPETAFTAMVDDVAVELSSGSPVTVRGRTVVLGLETALTADQDITVTYNDPTAGNDPNAIQDPAGNDAATLTDQAVTNRVGQRPSTPSGSGSSGSGSSGSTSSDSTPDGGTPQGPLVLVLTVPEAPIEVGQSLTYTVTIVNSGSEPLTGLSWWDKTADTAAQALSDLASGASVSATGTFGPMQDDHIPHIILTVAANSDQTDEIVTSTVVQVVAATTQSTEVNQQSGQLSGQPPTGVRPKVPSALVLRVIRVDFKVPDAHLAHNVPDLLVSLPDGSETSCNFLTHYENTGGLTRWGHTTSEVLEERPGSLTQYYQRGVVDCHVREGDWLMERRLAWDHFGGGVDGSVDLGVEPHLLSDQPGELLGPWGHKVSNYAVDGTYIGFLDVFTALGGVPAFGYPKSEARFDNDPRRQLSIQVATQGFIRQYFQAAVMEYHPDTLSTVMLRLLGDDLRDRRYPNQLYKAFVSFGSVPPLRVGQIYVAELVLADPRAAPPLTPPVELTPLPATTARPSTLQLRVDRFAYSEPDVHMGHNIPDLTLFLPNGSESTCNFLSYFEGNHGLARWGHPTSEVFEERDGVLTQYYQRGVLDCEEHHGQWSVTRRLAWDYVGGGGAGSPDLGVEAHLLSDQVGELVGPWNHRVSNYAVDGTFTGFLDFFTALGGADTFGFPKTEARYDDDPRADLGILGASRRVIRQYFQSAVLEFHPSDTVQPVKLRLLGDDVRDRLYPNQTYKAFGSFGPSVPLARGQIYTPERITPSGLTGTPTAAPTTAPPAPPTATRPFVTPPAPSTLGLRVERVLFNAPDVHLAHNIPDLALTLTDGTTSSCDFLTYYEANFDVARWGHAISEVLEERPGTLTQYFQRGVLDCEERDGEWRVERRLAWDYIGGGVDGAPDLGVEPDLSSTQPGEPLGPWGHRVSNYTVDGTYIGFLDFFTALGGAATFGLPKSDARYDDDPRAVLRVPNGDPGVIRQYFQAAVLEYHPDDVAQPVKLFLIGDALRDWRYPTYRAFASFGSFGPLSEGQPYYPPATSNVLRPAG